MSFCIHNIPVLPPLQLAALIAALCLVLPPTAKAGWNILGQPGDGRVDDGAVFTVPAAPLPTGPTQEFTFSVGSSLDQNKWWTSSNRNAPWDGVVAAAGSNTHLAMRVDEVIPAGAGFFFGFSFENEINGLKFDFRTLGGDSGASQLPGGTQIYIGFRNLDGPSGVTHSQHTINSGAPLGNAASPRNSNASPIIPSGVPPAFLVPPDAAGAYSWVQYQRPTGLPNTTTSVMGMDLSRTPATSATEVVFVIVLPSSGPGIPLATVPNQRLHFSWTIDGNPTLGPVNPNFGSNELLIPEPSRVMLISLAMALLLLRRSRPR